MLYAQWKKDTTILITGDYQYYR